MADTLDPDKRDKLGRFGLGNSGGPGRPRWQPEVREMLRAATPKAAKTLVDALDAEFPLVVGNGDSARLEYAPDFDLRVKAANAILDRVYGKPTQPIAGEDGGPAVVAVDLAAILERMAGE